MDWCTYREIARTEVVLDEQHRREYYKIHSVSQQENGWIPLRDNQYQALEKVMAESEILQCKGINQNVELKFYILDIFTQTIKLKEKGEFERLDSPMFMMDTFIDDNKIASLHFEPSAYGIRLKNCSIKKEYCDTYYTTNGISDLICERMERLSQEMNVNNVFFTGLQTEDVGSLKNFTFERRGYIYQPEDQFGECYAEKLLEPLQKETTIEES